MKGKRNRKSKVELAAGCLTIADLFKSFMKSKLHLFFMVISLSLISCHSDEQNEFFCLDKTIGEIQGMYTSKLNWHKQETTTNILYNIQMEHKAISFCFEKPSKICTSIRVRIYYDFEKKYADRYVKALDREWDKRNYTTWYDGYNRTMVVLKVDNNDNTYNFYFSNY